MYGRTSSAPTMFDHPMIDINQADGRLSSTASLTLHYPTSGILLMDLWLMVLCSDAQTVCCQDNSYGKIICLGWKEMCGTNLPCPGGLISIGCLPITL